MADVFTNDLRIREQEVGANSGQWGSLLNVSLENIAESWSYGTEALADSAAQTLTLADGASDQLRSFYVKLTGTLSQATTVTIAPNTISVLDDRMLLLVATQLRSARAAELTSPYLMAM